MRYVVLTEDKVRELFWTKGDGEVYWTIKEDVPVSYFDTELSKDIYNILVNK